MYEENVALVRRYYQETSGDMAHISEIVGPDFVDHHFPADLPAGPEGVKAFFNNVLGAFSNRHIEICDIFATHDKVAVRFSLVATHTADFAGYAASGKQIDCAAMSIFRVANGKLAEGWESADLLGLFNQLK